MTSTDFDSLNFKTTLEWLQMISNSLNFKTTLKTSNDFKTTLGFVYDFDVRLLQQNEMIS